MITLEQIEVVRKQLHGIVSDWSPNDETARYHNTKVDDLYTLAKRGLATMPRPIAEAPKDGTEILGMTERGIHESVYWNEISRTWRGPYTGLDLPSPTHFIPLSALEGE